MLKQGTLDPKAEFQIAKSNTWSFHKGTSLSIWEDSPRQIPSVESECLPISLQVNIKTMGFQEIKDYSSRQWKLSVFVAISSVLHAYIFA